MYSFIYIFALLLNSIAFGTYSPVSPFDSEPASLIKVEFSGQVGSRVPRRLGSQIIPEKTFNLLLTGFTRPPLGYWANKVRSQIRLAYYRMSHRRDATGKGQLVVPPESVWNIRVDLNSTRIIERNRRIFVVVNYNVTSYLIVRRGSIEEAEPSLTAIGGNITERFRLPLDPEFLFQKTGRACFDESQFPGVVDMIEPFNAWNYFNVSCTANSECHKTPTARDCIVELRRNTGVVTVPITWTRVAYDETIARRFRVGPSNITNSRDLVNVPQNDIRIFFKYIPLDDCLLQRTRCVFAGGWRRFLSFSTIALNQGYARFLRVARIGPGGNLKSFVGNQTLIYDRCFKQFKVNQFAHYNMGRFEGQPVATCIRDGWRFQNHEYSPLATEFDSCEYQGISSGWAHVIPSGTPCQWIDITRFRQYRRVVPLTSFLNPENVMCEGLQNHQLPRPKRPLFTNETELRNGRILDIQGCLFSDSEVKENNDFTVPVRPRRLRTSMTTKCPPQSRPYSHWRDCGWSVMAESLPCSPGQLKTISVSHNMTLTQPKATLVIRLCDVARRLGRVSTRCDNVNALKHAIVPVGDTIDISFICPSARDRFETGGLFSVMAAKYAAWETLNDVLPPIVINS